LSLRQHRGLSPQEVRFPCGRCGALQVYRPGSTELHCEYCSATTPVGPDAVAGQLRELPLGEALRQLDSIPGEQSRFTVQCENCAAEFSFSENHHAGRCPFCATPVVVKPGKARQIFPQGLIPFQVTETTALTAFENWLTGLWFAPGKLQNLTTGRQGLTGVYIPYWTYDSHTETTYQGERGIAYQVPERVVVTESGRRVSRTRMVTKVRWSPVSGRVSRFFDDVLVGASRSLPRAITDPLGPWQLEALVPFSEAYLSGYQSEIYQVRLDEGFNTALQIIDGVIRSDIARDIGGDYQRIHHLDTRHEKTSYKHILLPLYSSAFTFGRKSYRFVVNGQTGKVRGERPYSPWKIAMAVLAALLLGAGAMLLQGEM
jgi:ribosomal protein S27E